jgi:hypothetical protein
MATPGPAHSSQLKKANAYQSALDERLRAAVIVGFTFEFNHWLKYGGAHCTCTHLPGVFREMEWFEIAGLIAPRAVMMIQGGHDGIFPISGARRSGANVEHIFRLLGQSDRARFVELPGLPHAYSRPYRETMCGWMAWHLQGQGHGEPIVEGEIQTLPERDARLPCDPEKSFLPRAPTVVDLARQRGLDAVRKLDGKSTAESREMILRWARELTAPPETQPHLLSARTVRKSAVPGGILEKVSFNSEDGQRIPGLLWLPDGLARPAPTVLIVDERGKAAVAESGLVPPLLAAGHAVFAIDLRGRVNTGDYEVDFGAVIPSALGSADVPDIVALIPQKAHENHRPSTLLDNSERHGTEGAGSSAGPGVGHDAGRAWVGSADTPVERPVEFQRRFQPPDPRDDPPRISNTK